MAQLAISGHSTRGREVIAWLEMLGGENRFQREGDIEHRFYYIDKNKRIQITCGVLGYILFDLEGFEKKYPYKVGDKVIYEDKIREITKMVWEEQTNTIAYKLDDKLYCNVTNDLQPYEEENYCQVIGNDTSSNGVNTSASSINEEPEPEPKAPILSNRYDYAEGKCGYVIPDGYEFDYIKEGFQTEIILKPKKPTYPKDYKECCEVLGYSAIKDNGYKWNPETKTLEKLNKNKFDIANLKPFEKVLVRQNVNGKWGIDFFGFYSEGYYYTTGSCIYVQCIPYEGNQHLLGKTADCNEYFKIW